MKAHKTTTKVNETAWKINDDESLLTLSREDVLMLVAALNQPRCVNKPLQKASQAYNNQNQNNI